MSTAVDEADEAEGVDESGHRRPYRVIREEMHLIERRKLREQFGDNTRIDPEDDDIAWRRRIRTNPAGGMLWRGGVFTLGLLVILAGVPMVPLAGPGWAVVFIGLWLWSTEFIWARRATKFVKAEVKSFNVWVRALPWKAKVPLGIASLIFGWACAYLTLRLTGIPGWVPEPVSDWLLMVPGLKST